MGSQAVKGGFMIFSAGGGGDLPRKGKSLQLKLNLEVLGKNKIMTYYDIDPRIFKHTPRHVHALHMSARLSTMKFTKLPDVPTQSET